MTSRPWPDGSSTAAALWLRLPAWVGRWSISLEGVLGDGQYLLARPRVAALLPPIAMGAGFAFGVATTRETFSYSIGSLAVLAVAAGLGAGAGFWAWLGFVLGDVALLGESRLWLSAPSPARALARVGVPLLISYALLATLLVVAPITAVGLRHAVAQRLRLRTRYAEAVGVAAHWVVQSAAAFFWAQAAAFLIRPIWSYRGLSPSVEAIRPLQQQAWVLVAATAAAVGVRILLTHVAPMHVAPTHVASSMPPPALAPPRGTAAASARRYRARLWAGSLAKAVFFTLLLSGLIASLVEAVVVAGVLAATFAAPLLLPPRARRALERLYRVPLLARIVVAAALAYGLAALVVEPAVERGENSFAPLLAVLLLAHAATVLLLGLQRR